MLVLYGEGFSFFRKNIIPSSVGGRKETKRPASHAVRNHMLCMQSTYYLSLESRTRKKGGYQNTGAQILYAQIFYSHLSPIPVSGTLLLVGSLVHWWY